MIRNILYLLWERIVLLFIISVIGHAVIHLAPGEPSEVDPFNPMMKAADIEKIRGAFHLDEPLWKQYTLWIGDLARGELRSFKDGQPVLSKIWQRFLNSLPLFIVSTLLVWTISFPIGIHAALTRGSLGDRISNLTAWGLISIPGFVLAYLLILGIVESAGVPVIGRHTFGNEGAPLWFSIIDLMWHITPISLMMAVLGIATLSRYARSQMLDVIEADYVRTARAKGLDESVVIYRHALRNALLPFITMFGLMVPGLVGGSVIIETIFAWPGIGRLAYEAILSRDYPIILTVNLLAAVLTLIGILISDILYAVADPRIRYRTG
ncbi:MAG: ABC transporter permease [Ectothiorhodospiraceae bacterium AqS1]|nr:ABC transporter permease [Ectothiorhodospiraceae bacterium AqS1]